MDFESVLAKFTAPGPIESRTELDVALFELLRSIAESRDDVPSLLNVLASGTLGLLEAVLTSRNHYAFEFRYSIAKALRKSAVASDAAFRLCASRLSQFLIALPPSVALDRSVMEDCNALNKATTSDESIESEYPSTKGTRSKPDSPTKSRKRNQRRGTISLTSPRSANSQPVRVDGDPSLDESKLVKRLIENFFASCICEEIEDCAFNNLLEILNDTTKLPSDVPTISALQTLSPSSADNSLLNSIPDSETSSRPLHYLSLKPEDIADYLSCPPRLKSGNWPVAVSQRGIKRLREFLPAKKDIFLRIEKKIKQLSVGFFPSTNQTNLLKKDFGIPIYVADLGDDLQLIYHIDFGAPTGTDEESQFIRVFGVYPKSEVDKEFWSTVAAQLDRRGREYIERCTDKGATRIRFKGIETTPPTVSSPLSVSQWYKEGADIEVNEAYFLQLHRILALEKYVPLSPTFFEAIQKFDEYSFMFQPSSNEYRIIHHPSSCLVLGRSGTGKTTCMLFRMLVLERSSQKSSRPLRQIFVTRSPMLVYQVQQYWKKIQQKEQDTAAPDSQKIASFSLLDLDENAEGKEGLPSKFSELNDSHFPLFLTYDQLCKLLEADYDLEFEPSTDTSLNAIRARRTGKSIRQPLVDFEFFQCHIWPHLDEKVKAGLHPANVYGEFMGVIKGSEDSLRSNKCQLDRWTYESQSTRTNANDQSERSRVYTLFEAYAKKRPPNSYDIADRAQALVKELQQNGVPGKGIDFLYVDEVQDHLMVDIALLRYLCRNSYGLFFAGDTAQTISLGSAFRFDELKAFLYRLEREDSLVKHVKWKAIDPDFFQLSVNYRCHSGIVNAAAFLVGLISSYFGYSIDSLLPEASLVDVCAQKPTFMLERDSPSDFIKSVSGTTGVNVPLGAHQAIIVRDDTAAQNLQAVVGDIPGLLTLYQSKGLEFDDVVLYDFFADSPATSTDWRAILHSQREGKPFDERKHSILQRELKSLYVGLTRARERVWIWDRSDNGNPLEELLVSSKLAIRFDMASPMPQIGVSSSSEEWSHRGQQYFSKGLYTKAGTCFKNAGMTWWESVCRAYDDKKTASRLSQGHQNRVDIFSKAAEEFEHLAKDSVSQTTRYRLLTNAGECYAAISDYTAAARVFLAGEKYTKAAYNHSLSGQYEEAVRVIRQHPVDQAVGENIIYKAKLAYTRRGNMPSLQKAWDLCGSKEEFLKFLQSHGFDEQRVTVHDSLEEHEQAGDILWEGGKYLRAIDRFRRTTALSSRRKATACLLDGLRTIISFANGYGKQSPLLSALFELSKDSELSLDEVDEVDLLRAVANYNAEHLKAKSRHYRSSGNALHALFAFDALISSGVFRSMRSASEKEVIETLRMCQTFDSLIHAALRTPGILDRAAGRDLFGVSGITGIREETISVKYPSFTHTALAQRRLVPKKPTSSTVSVALSSLELVDQIRQALMTRLNQVISDVELLARESRAFQLCSSFLSTGQCDDIDTTGALCWKTHLLETDRVSATRRFNSQFRLHILMISFLDRYSSPGKNGAATWAEKQQLWLARLFKLCYPPTNKSGNLLDIEPSLIPEYQQTMETVRSCLRRNFKGLRPLQNPKDFSDNIIMISFLATALDHVAAVSYLKFEENKSKKAALDERMITQKQREEEEREAKIAKDYRLLNPKTQCPIADAAVTWCTQKTTDSIEMAVSFLEDALTGNVWLDIEVAIAFTEEVCGQLMFNYKMHHPNDSQSLMMPRSWIMRALSRGPSLLPEDDKPGILMTALGKFIDILLLKDYDDYCWLQVERTSLNDVKSDTKRNHTIIRACRCLALLGHNIPGLRELVLTIFDEMDNCPFLATVSKDLPNSPSLDWSHVVEALKLGSSHLDELLVVNRKEEVVTDIPRLNKALSLERRQLADEQPILPHASASSPIVPGTQEQPLSQSVRMLSTLQILPRECKDPMTSRAGYDTADNKRSEETWHLSKSAKPIQSSLHLHRSPAAGPIVKALEDVIKLRIQMSEVCADDRFLIFCLRGLLLHVIAYLERVQCSAGSLIEKFKRQIGGERYEEVDDSQLSEERVKLREIQNHAKKIVDELLPTSEFHFDGTSNSPASLSDILRKVRAIPGLVETLHPFATLPNKTLPDEDKIDREADVNPLLIYLTRIRTEAKPKGSTRH